ncbi:Translation machinery-associated protein 22 [Modicella reniformis]|uniref:Translation machinery-associated protein 22 n=1 Tax=Modicella reniformis TaxID=1440133 RepID=A0A9P6JFR8_9FUNG|nr:Translation machinery-associated protein 22 [Modicella reniformis]
MADSPDAPSSEHVQPREVPYCGFCTLPPEYCEFGPTLDKCKEWLSKHDKVLYSILYNTLEDQLAAASLESKPEEDKKKAKEAAKLEKQLQRKLQSKVLIKRIERTKKKCITSVFGLENFGPNRYTPGCLRQAVARISVYLIIEIEPYTLELDGRQTNAVAFLLHHMYMFAGIDLKKAAKLFANKFACGSSVTKNNQGNDEIVVQGDVSEDILELIVDNWPEGWSVVPEENIELVEDRKKGK